MHALTIPKMTSVILWGDMGHQSAEKMPPAQSARGHCAFRWGFSRWHTMWIPHKACSFKEGQGGKKPWGCMIDPEGHPFM